MLGYTDTRARLQELYDIHDGGSQIVGRVTLQMLITQMRGGTRGRANGVNGV